MVDPDDIPGRTAPTNTTGDDSAVLGGPPYPEPGDPQQVAFRDLCHHPGCTESPEPGSDYCSNPLHGPTREFSTRPRDLFTRRDSNSSTDGEIEELRRDVNRLEGKVDALLTALEVDDGGE
jgi:hypothetical protein